MNGQHLRARRPSQEVTQLIGDRWKASGLLTVSAGFFVDVRFDSIYSSMASSLSLTWELSRKSSMVMFGGSGKYASALYVVAVKANSVEKVESEILQFVESVKNSTIIFQVISKIYSTILLLYFKLNIVHSECLHILLNHVFMLLFNIFS
ncbi:hypothetical protein AHAS_Ahas16G0285700 [Arachis hypogaea]